MRRKKLIATGWDNVDQVQLKKQVRQMEDTPFDGIMMRVVGQREDGRACHLRNTQTADAWKRSWFHDALSDLQAAEFQVFTDNFVSVGANPGNVDWFDDEGWDNVVEHWAIAAWLAREAGFQGFLFDPEPYHKPYAQFRYGAQADRDRHTFEQYRIKARERGRQVMAAVAQEFADITIFCYFMHSVNAPAARALDKAAVLQSSTYGLFPAFIDGWLDAAPPTVRFVDGCERAYLFNSEVDYLRSAVSIKGECQNLVSPENRSRYRAQVEVSYGVYLDAYWNPSDSKWARWSIERDDRQPVQQLLQNVRHGIECCDRYLWIYGEKFRWWPTDNARVFDQRWPEALPNCDLALRLARDPLRYARYMFENDRVSAAQKNLARNGTFEAASAVGNEGKQQDWSAGGAPAGWHVWQLENGNGVFSWDQQKGAAKAAGVPESGCFIQTYDVTPGESYAVRARVRTTGSSVAWIRVRWQTSEGRWTRQNQDVMITPDPPDVDDWQALFGAATVPAGVGKMVLLLGMGGQPTREDAVWFDDVEVHRLAETGLFSSAPVRFDLEP